MTDLPPAGWYDDPTSPLQERWWDGEKWSEQTRRKVTQEYQFRFGELRRVSDFLGHAFNLIRARWDDFLLIAAVGALLTAVAAAALVYPIIDAIEIVDNQIIGFEASHFVMLVGFFVVAVIVLAAAAMAMYRTSWSAASDQGGGWTDAIQYGIAAAPRLLGWGLLAVLPILGGIALAVLLARVGAFVAFLGVFGFLIGVAWWSIVISLLPAALVVQPRGTNPFRPAIATVTGRWWRIFGRLLLIGLIAGLIVQVISAIAFQLVGGSFFGLDFVERGPGDFEIVKSLRGQLDFFVSSLAATLMSYISYVPQFTGVTSIAYDVMPRPDAVVSGS